jgi:hypothetical protein
MDALTAEPRTDLVPEALLDPVVAYFKPRRVIRFGSMGRGDNRPDSDYDLLVILDDDAPAALLSWRAGYEARKDYRHPANVIPCNADWSRRTAGICGTIPYAAANEGIIVYEQPA